MKRRQSCADDPNVYEDTPERRTLDLRPDGIDCIPLLGMSRFTKIHSGTEYHIHPGCVEMCLCLRGRLVFESEGAEFPFFPGTVFVSQPHEPHRMRNNPKGLLLMRILFAVPEKDVSILGLSKAESRWLVDRVRRFPMRLFPATDRVKSLFQRLFEIYDGERRGTVARRLKLKIAVLDLLMAMVDAPHAEPTPKGKSNPRINEIIRRMREHPETEYKIESLAAEAALSTVAFNDAFKCAAGLPPHAYLVDQRVRAAERDLRDPALSVSAVAGRYRFSSPQHMASVFRRVAGHAPRRANTKQQD